MTILIVILIFSILSIADAKKEGKDNKNFKLGVEVLLSEQKDLIKGKRVGLITSPTGVDQNLNSIVDILHKDPDIKLTALYGPEHGVRGSARLFRGRFHRGNKRIRRPRHNEAIRVDWRTVY
jgi:uncharacterized protein YbbC (DUF1343 family)